jgi:hypothetical protein
MPDGQPPSREEILASLMQYQQDARTSKRKVTRIKGEKEIGDGVPESEMIITETPHGYLKDHVERFARFGCGCFKPESEIGASCQQWINRKQRCNRIICKECMKEKVCYDCGARLCEDHWVKVETSEEKIYYFCERCAKKRAGRKVLKGLLYLLLAPFLVKEKKK